MMAVAGIMMISGASSNSISELSTSSSMVGDDGTTFLTR